MSEKSSPSLSVRRASNSPTMLWAADDGGAGRSRAEPREEWRADNMVGQIEEIAEMKKIKFRLNTPCTL